MAEITTKELGSLTDQMTVEKNLICKYEAYAKIVTDPEMKRIFESNAKKHQQHLNELFANLK